MNVKEQEHCKRVAALGCYICGAEPQLHHIRNDGTGNAGIGRRNSHFSVVPLCYNHHLGPFSIHNKKLLFEQSMEQKKKYYRLLQRGYMEKKNYEILLTS